VLSKAYGGEAMSSVMYGINGSMWAHMSKLQMNTMPITFFGIKCIIPFEFISQGQTVTQTYFAEILKGLW
jgi:uncharacterized membrane protein YjjP (DUF1212 family)